MADIFFLDRRAGLGNILLSFSKRSADGMQTRNEFSFLAQLSENFLTYAGHNVHVAYDVGAVGYFYTNFGDG